MMTVCAECGKWIVVTWPEFYVYKRSKGEDTCYFCSENCMIVSDVRDTKERSGWNDEPWITEGELEDIQAGRKPFRMLRRPTSRNSRPPAEKDRPGKPAGQEREDRTMAKYASSHKLTREEKERAVELAIDGKDPIGYLKECGCKNPWSSWAYIKNVLKKSKPELYAKIPSDDDRLDEEVSYGAQTAPAADPPVPADDPEAADPLEGFEAVDVNQQKAPEEDLTIKAEDLQAAEDPAVARMEQFATMEQKPEAPRDRVRRIVDDLFRFPENVIAEQNPAGRVVLDKDGVHLEPPKEPKKPDLEKMTFFGIPCEVTALKIDDFEFAKDREGMRAVLPGGTIMWGSTMYTPAIMTAEQWKRLAEIIPKVMKILRIE